MSDKDQFTFDDKDDFPEADLSSAFSDGEFEADNPAPDAQQMPEPPQDKQSKGAANPTGPDSSRTRILLIILLLVVAGGAGVYYFMDLGGSSPVVPTVVAPAQKTQKTVALPPQPAKPDKPVTVAVPPPPAQPSPEPVATEPVKPAVAEPARPVAEGARPAPVQQQATDKPEPAPIVKADQKPAQKSPAVPDDQGTAVAAKQPETDQPVARTEPVPVSKTAQRTTATKPASAPAAMPSSSQGTAPAQAADGPFTLDAGSYLFEANRDALVAKIEKLGYQSLVTPVDAKLDMTRLRLGTYRKDEVRQALDFARSIEPGAYTAPAGDGFVIYAGTFLKKGTVDRLTKRFIAEGVKVQAEPVQVVRTLSRIRFGSFATREEAVSAANAAGKAGVEAVVVKAR